MKRRRIGVGRGKGGEGGGRLWLSEEKEKE
jgi:hypothetical protein